MSKRLKIIIAIIVSSVPTIIHFVFLNRILNSNFSSLFLSSFGFAILSCIFLYISMYWILERPMKLIAYITYMLFPSMFAFPFLYLFNHLFVNFHVEVLPLFTYIVVLIFLIYMVCLYAISLSVNILNVSSVSKIPLAQAANTIIFIFTFLTGYLYFSILTSLNLNYFLTSVLLFFISFFLLFQAFSNIINPIVQCIKLSAIGAFTVFELSIFLLPWKISSFILAIIFTVVLYIFHSIILHEDKNSFNKEVIAEYVLLSVLALSIIIITSSEWGISGGLF